MASALEIGRTQGPGNKYQTIAEVLVRPPLKCDEEDFSRSLGKVVFGQNYTARAASRQRVTFRETNRLGDEAQIVKLNVFDSETEGGPGAACDMAVAALHTYVTAMAEGKVDELVRFLPVDS